MHVGKSKELLDTAGGFARISWISGPCSYRAAEVAILRGQVQEAIEEAEKAVAIG
jgi:hypothetical protein